MCLPPLYVLQAKGQSFSYALDFRTASREIMNGITDYKIWGAILGTALFTIGLINIGDVVYHAEAPTSPHDPDKKPGFLIEVAEAEEAGGGGEAAAVESIGARLAKADVAAGQKAEAACAACHNINKGGANKTGPVLYDIVERQIASVADFGYSDGAKAKSGEKWTYENLDAFLTKPAAFIEGTKMKFGGIKNAQKRADLIAYLAAQSDAPKPFPAP
jgi:cytochrome c